jgi:hypothetical protein
VTAEIALLNKSAVALAADSAVSIPQGGGYKIYNSVNKLFQLSKHAPVGVMIYGSAEFMGTPWETFIKLYRTELGERRFALIEDYAEDFVRYLTSCPQFFPQPTQDDFVHYRVNAVLIDIAQMADSQLDQLRREQGKLSESDVRTAFRNLINGVHDWFESSTDNEGCDPQFAQSVFDRHEGGINGAIDQILPRKSLTRGSVEKLRSICKLMFQKRFSHGQLSTGVVIAGFGEDEIFPSVSSLAMDGYVNSHLLYLNDYKASITHEMTAVVAPFAQRELVLAFMNGVNPDYQDAVEAVMSEMVKRYPSMVELALPSLPDADKRRLRRKLDMYGQNTLKDVFAAMAMHRKDAYSDPILEAVQVLPKDELATMAATLVNLTSFKQRMTLDYETVGGPIDVAVISKGDGFIWIQRKHYFDKEFNPQFFANYNRAVDPSSNQRRNGAAGATLSKRVPATVVGDASARTKSNANRSGRRSREASGPSDGPLETRSN